MPLQHLESARVHYGPRSEELDHSCFPQTIDSDNPADYLEEIRKASVKAHNWWGQQFEWRRRPLIESIPGSKEGTGFHANGFSVIYS